MNITKHNAIPKLQKKLCVAAYARVSSGKDVMLRSLSAQISYYSEYIQSHADWLYCGVFYDEAVTGTKSERKGFQELLTKCRAGEIDVIITKSISRFARNTVTLLETVRELKSLGIDVYFEEQRIHTLSSTGEMILTFLASVAEEETRITSERMRWRVHEKYEKGQPWNGTVYGYHLDNGKYAIVPDEAVVIRYIFDRYLSGKGVNSIANELNAVNIPSRFGRQWRKKSVMNILQNDIYIGNLLLQKTYRPNHRTKQKVENLGEYPMYSVEGAHDAIIRADVFAVAQEEIARRANLYTPPKPKQVHYEFTGRITCGVCGKKYRRKKRGDKVTWVCDTKNMRGVKACSSCTIPEYVLTETAADVLPLQIIGITANQDSTLRLQLSDGTAKTISWSYRSRSESWTLEMKQKAREQFYASHHKNTSDKKPVHGYTNTTEN